MPSGSPPPLLRNVLRVAHEGTYGPCTWAVVHHFDTTPAEPIPTADMDAVLSTIAASFATRFISGPDSSNNLHYTRINGVRMNDSGTGVKRRALVTDTSGDGGTDDDPGQVAYLYNWTTDDPRRGGKARSYLPGVLDSDQLDQGRLTGAVQATRTAQALLYLAEANAASHGVLTGLQMVEYSIVDSLAYRAEAAIYTIDGVTCNNVLGTQRRRVGRLRT
jgi:hypothetical protein